MTCAGDTTIQWPSRDQFAALPLAEQGAFLHRPDVLECADARWEILHAIWASNHIADRAQQLKAWEDATFTGEVAKAVVYVGRRIEAAIDRLVDAVEAQGAGGA